MDTREGLFREKSRSRASFRNYGVIVLWALLALGFLAFVTAAIAGLNEFFG